MNHKELISRCKMIHVSDATFVEILRGETEIDKTGWPEDITVRAVDHSMKRQGFGIAFMSESFERVMPNALIPEMELTLTKTNADSGKETNGNQ